ncbi:MAG: hypothetical protein ACKOCE_10735 [Acidimicrobiia bacterium]
MLGTLNLPSVETTTVSDSGNTLVVLVVTGSLVLAGLALAALGVWYWRGTIPDPDSLGPLHSMSSHSFVGLDEVERRRRLDVMRPSLADELATARRVARTTSTTTDAVDPIDAVAPPTAVDDAPVDQHVEAVGARGVIWEDDDDSWPGDDWSDLEGWGESDAVESSDVVVEEGFEEPTPPRRPSIDPLIG